jgi:hypothetical protein
VSGPQQLPEQHTARRLGRALAAIPGLPVDMIERADRGYFHDYLSPLALPELALVSALRDLARDRHQLTARSRRMCTELANAVIRGEYDASPAEADEWAASPDGKSAMAELLRGGLQRTEHRKKGRRQ